MQPQTQQPPSPTPQFNRPAPIHEQRTPKRGRWLAAGLVVLAVLVLAGLAGYWWINRAHGDETKHINPNEYQALFLTNGQVYFGKLADLNRQYVTITDIYYLQVQQGQTLQSGSTSTNTAQSQVSLAKLGSELHGPEDKMFVASDQVLFWENLHNDSKVVQAINKAQNQ